MRYALFLALGSILASCNSTKTLYEAYYETRFDKLFESPEALLDNEPPHHHEEICRTIITFSTAAKYELHLHLEDAKVLWRNGMPFIRLKFISQDILELCDVRELLVDFVEGLLYRLNHVTSMKWSALNLDMTVNFESDFIEFSDQWYIGYLTLQEGIVRYYAGDIKNPRLDTWHTRTEAYYKSLEFVYYHRLGESAYRATNPYPPFPRKPLRPFRPMNYMERRMQRLETQEPFPEEVEPPPGGNVFQPKTTASRRPIGNSPAPSAATTPQGAPMRRLER